MLLRILLLVLLVGAGVVAWSTGLHEQFEVEQLRELLARTGFWGPLLFVLLFGLEGIEVDPREGTPRWRDRVVPLDPHAGGPAAFRFEARARVAEPTGLPLWSVPTLFSEESAGSGTQDPA